MAQTTFPTSVWDGTTGARPNFSVNRGPSGIDWDRAVEEIRAMQDHALNGPIVRKGRTITVDGTILANDYAIYLDGTSNAIDFTLTDPSTDEGRVIVVQRIDSSGFTVTLLGTVNGEVNPTLADSDTLTLQAHNGSWRII